MPRIQGRTLRPSTLAERRYLLSLGVDTVAGLRLPRSKNPYQVARVLQRLAEGVSPDANLVRKIVETNKARAFVQLPFSTSDHDHAEAD